MLDEIIAATPFTAAVAVSAALLLTNPFPTDGNAVANENRTTAQAASDASSRTPLGMVVNWARTVKAGQSHPESLAWEEMLASRDGSVVCLAYRARGEGGTVTRERIAFVSGPAGTKKASWDAACTSELSRVAEAEKWVDLL